MKVVAGPAHRGKRRIDALDINPTVLHSFDAIRNLDELARGGIGIGEGTSGHELFHLPCPRHANTCEARGKGMRRLKSARSSKRAVDDCASAAASLAILRSADGTSSSTPSEPVMGLFEKQTLSLQARCHGLCGSQKYTSILVASVKRR